MMLTASNELAGQRVAVIGLAATGLATARALHDLGAVVTVYDSKPAIELDKDRVFEAQALEGVALSLGAQAYDWSNTDIVIPSPGVPRSADPIREAIEQKVLILSEIEIAYRLAKAPILAITGTNGKTTTTALLGAICRTACLNTWVAGNIAEDDGVRLPLIEAAIHAPADGVIIAEISSFQLEWVDQFRPKVAAWLNLSNDHLDRHADVDEYARAKSNLFRAQTADDWAIINDEDPLVVQYAEGVGHAKRVRFGLSRRIWLHSQTEPCTYLDGQSLVAENFHTAGEALHIVSRHDITIPGTHNVANILAAAAMALAFGIDVGSIRAGIRQFAGVAHRMEYVASVDGIRFINNSMCTNPAAVVASLEAVEGPIVAIVGGIHKGGELSDLTNALAKRARHVVLIGQSGHDIGRLLETAKNAPTIEYAETLPAAVRVAAYHANVGDTVLLVPGCASFDMFRGFEHRGQVFRDAVKTLQMERA